MKFSLFSTLKGYKKNYLIKDIIAGIIIAAVSIPISMGYAQIAGLPAVYGLYGSVFPIIIFGIFSTSRQFIFGVDAAPAALVGTALISMGIEGGSDRAMAVVPVITLLVAAWLLIFSFMKAGKLVNYISAPVMGGFISGICTTIILMQLPKLFGGSAGTGELFELVGHLIKELEHINFASLGLGVATLAILLIVKKVCPKFPMAVVMMVLGALLTLYGNIDREFGIACLSAVEPGMPRFLFPDLTVIEGTELLGISLSVAIVIMAETLLAEHNFANKNGYKLNDDQEILAFSMSNAVAAVTGCCPMNGSVSRTSMNEQYGGKTQLTGIIAGVVMIFVLLSATGFIGYLPVPVLTAIVISALLGATEFHLAKKLFKVSRREFYIFCGAFVGVLILGTIYGVLVGIILSFALTVIESANPPRQFLGVIPGYAAFQDISRFKNVRPVQGVIIYRFSSDLMFANVGVFQNDIESAIKDDTRAVIVDAGGITSIDATAAERIELLYEGLKKKNIRFYITEHIAALNDQLRKMGMTYMIEDGVVRHSIETALSDMGIEIDRAKESAQSPIRQKAETTVQEFVWAFGDMEEPEIEKLIHRRIEKLKETGNVDALFKSNWHGLDAEDEEEWLQYLELHIDEIADAFDENEEIVTRKLENRRTLLLKHVLAEHPELKKHFDERRAAIDRHIKEHNPHAYEKLCEIRNKLIDHEGNI